MFNHMYSGMSEYQEVQDAVKLEIYSGMPESQEVQDAVNLGISGFQGA